MRKLKVAFVNNVQYCKFPEGISNIEEFIKCLNGNYHSFVELEMLVEEGCVAPFFIEEDLKIEKQYWNPSAIRNIKESEVFILPRWEYEEKLRKVIAEKCVHCVYYSENKCEEDDISHIEHIDLNGKCYGYENKKQ